MEKNRFKQIICTVYRDFWIAVYTINGFFIRFEIQGVGSVCHCRQLVLLTPVAIYCWCLFTSVVNNILLPVSTTPAVHFELQKFAHKIKIEMALMELSGAWEDEI